MHQNALDIPFLFDDRDTVLLNASLIAPWDWRAAILHNPARPVVNLSFAIDRALWGFSSFGFHITNVVLHIVTVGLFYGWCTRALGTKGVRPGSDPFRPRMRTEGVRPGSEPLPDWAAFFAAAIFAAHPVMGTAVGYVTARSELLAACGFLASLIYARRAIVAKHRTSGILAIVFGVLAVASSSSAAVLPLIVLAFDAWVLRDPGWMVRALRIYAPATLAVATAAAWHVTGSAIDAIPSRGPMQNLLTEVQVLWRYLALLVVPRGQALVHDTRWVSSVLDPLSIAMLAALTAGVAIAVWKRRTYPLVALGVVWFVGVLAPTTSFIPVRDAMAEHRLYLASAGLLLAAASVSWQRIASRRAIRVALAAVVFVLAVATYRRNEVWARPMTLWEEAVHRAPGAWQAHWGYAELLRELGRCDRARPEYDAVLRLYPDHTGARAGLAICRQP